jgi:hypothetical protein
LFAGLFGAIAVWIAAFPYAMTVGVRRFLSVERWITYGSGFIMGAFAAYFAFLAPPLGSAGGGIPGFRQAVEFVVGDGTGD